MFETLNQVDLCFVIDTTGSMGPFIAAAQQHLLDTIKALQSDNKIDLQVGLVEYRDHPPQDKSFVTRLYSLTPDLKRVQKTINGLKADGGGDFPEAVYDGVYESSILMDWREHSCRFILLVGDAPPHGYKPQHVNDNSSHKNRRPSNTAGPVKGCLCGLDVKAVSSAAEAQRVTVHALCMSNSKDTVGAFTELAANTGGQCATAKDAQEVVARIMEMLANEFRNLQLDQRVLETAQQLSSLDVKEISEKLSCPQLQAASSIARLGRRGFWAAKRSDHVVII